MHFLKKTENIESYISDISKTEKKALTFNYTHERNHTTIPSVNFKILKTEASLQILFSIKELRTKADYCSDQLPIFKDSCVEIFIQDLTDKSIYHNFEVNPLGYILSAHGPERNDRTPHTPEVLATIKRGVEHDRPLKEQHIPQWNLFLEIPAHIFGLKKETSLQHSPIIGNVYKCGDKLIVPHWLSHFPIATEAPDFHRPEAFQELA